MVLYRSRGWKVEVGSGLKSLERLGFLVGYSVDTHDKVLSCNDTRVALEGRRNGRAGWSSIPSVDMFAAFTRR